MHISFRWNTCNSGLWKVNWLREIDLIVYKSLLELVREWIIKKVNWLHTDVENITFFSLPFSTQIEIRENDRDIFNLYRCERQSTHIFGGIDLCEAHERMEAMAGYCVWMDDFIPASGPQKHLIESLLWHLHSEGVCCAVSGPFPAHPAGRFKQLLVSGLYIAVCGTSESESVKTVIITVL